MKKVSLLFFLFSSLLFSQPVINGVMDDPQYTTLASWDGAANWGANNQLGSIKFYSDGTKLYIGISGCIEQNWNKILLLINFSGYNGIAPNTKLPAGGNGFFTNLGGTDPDIETDFALSFTCDGGNPLYCDAIRYNTNSIASGGDGIGSSDKVGNPSTLDPSLVMQRLGGTTGGFTQAYLADFNRTTNSNHGLELAIDITAFATVTKTSTVNFFVAIVNGDGGWFSNQFLPDYYNTTGGATGLFKGDFGTDPDFDWQAWNARTNSGFSNVHFYTTPMQSLPVELTSFTAVRTNNNTITLNWKTSTEINNQGFDVLRSLDGKDWTSTGFVKGNNNSTTTKEYSFQDKVISYEKLYYRLKQVDHNGDTKLSDITEVNRMEVPGSLVLEQNYPNPFNPATNIRFTVKNSSQTTLRVYDAIGTMVQELFNGNAESGKTYSVKFDGKELSSGVYFYQLTSGNNIESKKLLLLK